MRKRSLFLGCASVACLCLFAGPRPAVAASEPGNASVVRDTAMPASAPAARRFTILARSASDVAQIRADLVNLAETVMSGGPRVLRVETTRATALLSALSTNDKVEHVEAADELYREPDPEPPVINYNINARLTHNVQMLRDQYNSVSGKGIGVAIWDDGQILRTHDEFQNRVIVRNPNAPPKTHATHVAGTIGAWGAKDFSQGMAPEATLYSFSLHEDERTLPGVALNDPGIFVTNHSYAAIRGWSYHPELNAWVWFGDPTKSPTEDYRFGKYSARSVFADELVASHPRLSIFVAAGNARDPDRNPNSRLSWNGRHLVAGDGRPLVAADGRPMVAATSEFIFEKRPSNAQHGGGYDTIEGMALGKNVITIGAIENVDDGLSADAPDKLQVTNFSSWGPADDGRIKPDLVANGARLHSSSVELNANGEYKPDGYKHLSGSSQASPTAAGIGTLLNELSIQRRGNTLRADEMKAALISTAISPSPGPTYQIGWGAIDALAAGRLVSGDQGTLLSDRFRSARDHTFKAERTTGPVRVTLVWIDAVGRANTGGLNDRTAALVHDLDLHVTDSRTKEHHPWSLDPNQPAARATQSGANRRDNVERVDISAGDAPSGLWTIEIKGPDTARDVPFALAIQGLKVMPR
jgi:subtilisin family serine protease